MIIRWLDTALKEIENIQDYIKKDSEYYSIYFTKRIFDYAELLINSPKMGRIVPEIKKNNVREIIYRNYRIIYRIFNDEIQILSVFHGARDLRKKKNRNWESN